MWQFIIAVLFVAVVLGVVGRPKAAKPVIERVVYSGHHAPKFTESLLLTALRQCGAEPKDVRTIQVIQPPAKIRSGWEAVVSLGVPAAEIIKKQSAFSSVLDRPENCVWLSSDTEESAGWLRIVVTRKSLRRTRVPAWPLLNGGSFNYFVDGVPIGVDETGQPVTAKKAYWSSVYGGIMGTGKSVSMMTTLMGLLADPRVEAHVYDLKGGSDWLPLTPILHFLRSGSDDADHEAIIDDLEELNKRMDRRFRTLKGLPDELASPKTTDSLASMRNLDLHPIVIVIDETQEMFELGDNKKRYYELVSRLVKKGRAVGITVEAGTQEVNKQSLPIAGLCRWRFCHGVQGHSAVELVLGTGSYSAGYHADELTSEDVGIGYFGSGKKFSVVKGYFINPDSPDGATPSDLDNVVARFKADRAGKDLLTGMAAGEIEPDDDHETVLDRVKRIWPTGTEKLQWVELIELLNIDMPGEYPTVGDLSGGVPANVKRAVDVLSGQLGRHGVEAKSVKAKYRPLKGKTISVRRGIEHADVINAKTPDVDMLHPDDTELDNHDTFDDIQDDITDDTTHDITDDVDIDSVDDTTSDIAGDIEADGTIQ